MLGSTYPSYNWWQFSVSFYSYKGTTNIVYLDIFGGLGPLVPTGTDCQEKIIDIFSLCLSKIMSTFY